MECGGSWLLLSSAPEEEWWEKEEEGSTGTSRQGLALIYQPVVSLALGGYWNLALLFPVHLGLVRTRAHAAARVSSAWQFINPQQNVTRGDTVL